MWSGISWCCHQTVTGNTHWFWTLIYFTNKCVSKFQLVLRWKSTRMCLCVKISIISLRYIVNECSKSWMFVWDVNYGESRSSKIWMFVSDLNCGESCSSNIWMFLSSDQHLHPCRTWSDCVQEWNHAVQVESEPHHVPVTAHEDIPHTRWVDTGTQLDYWLIFSYVC